MNGKEEELDKLEREIRKMSEFSESYHLLGTKRKEGVKLIKRARLNGYVISNSNKWVSFVVEGSEFKPNKAVIEANKGILLHYYNAEDHGWGFSIFKENSLVCQYECMLGEDLNLNDENLDIEFLVYISDGTVSKEAFLEMLYPTDFIALFENNPAYKFAEMIGLQHYEWLSYDYVYADAGDDLNSDIISVGI